MQRGAQEGERGARREGKEARAQREAQRKREYDWHKNVCRLVPKAPDGRSKPDTGVVPCAWPATRPDLLKLNLVVTCTFAVDRAESLLQWRVTVLLDHVSGCRSYKNELVVEKRASRQRRESGLLLAS